VRRLQALRLGTRGSQLALWQAHAVAARLEAAGCPPPEVVIIRTSGDRLAEAPLSEVGGKRLFVKEIEEALAAGTIDLAVHSCKDLPAVLPEGLVIAGVLPREDPRDAVVLPSGSARTPEAGTSPVAELVAACGQSPTIGTGSVRRIGQLRRLLPGARFVPLRGNLDTRLRKLEAGECDALVLAAAGLRRLGFESRISVALPVAACVPAPGQGIVAIETRANDAEVRRQVQALSDPTAEIAMVVERAFVEALGGGCQTPVGALASMVEDRQMELAAVVVAVDGSRAVRASARAASEEAVELGASLARRLLAEGGDAILAEARGVHGPAGGLQP
jgi:hydroxymethylbilane synthase